MAELKGMTPSYPYPISYCRLFSSPDSGAVPVAPGGVWAQLQRDERPGGGTGGSAVSGKDNTSAPGVAGAHNWKEGGRGCTQAEGAGKGEPDAHTQGL